MFYILSHLVFGLLLAVVFYCTGALVDRLALGGSALEPWMVAGRFGLGGAVWIGLVFVLASIGQLVGWLVIGLAVVIVVSYLVVMRFEKSRAPSSSRTVRLWLYPRWPFASR